jgi:hypothetical protein
MALHYGNRAAQRVRGTASSFQALEKANAMTRSGPAEYWSGRMERAQAAKARLGTTFTDVAYFQIDSAPVEVVHFVPAEEDTSGW